MPDPAIPEAPRVTNKEALHMHNEDVQTAGINQDHLARIKAWREQSKDPRDTLKNIADGKLTVSFSPEQTTDLKKSFGGGKVDTTGEFNGTDPASIEGQLHAEAKSVIEGLAKFQKYSEILSDAARTGKSEEDVAQEKGITDLAAFRTEALGIISDKLLTEIDPELTQINNPDAMLTIIDERLAKDPAFRREISTLLSQIKRPKTEVTNNAEAAVLGNKINELQDQETRAKAEIQSYIEAAGIDLSALKVTKPDGSEITGKDALTYLINDYTVRKQSIPDVMNNLLQDIIPIFPETTSEYLPFIQEEKRIAELKTRMNTTTNSEEKESIRRLLQGTEENIRSGPSTTVREPSEEEINAESDRLSRKTPGDHPMNEGTLSARARFRDEALRNLRGVDPATGTIKVKGLEELQNEKRQELLNKPDSKFNDFMTIYSLLDPKKENNTTTSRIAQRLQEVARVKTEVENSEIKRAQSETTSGQALSKSKDERIAEERAAIAELRGIVPRAIATTLLDRAKKADAALAKDYANKFDADTKGLLDRIQRTKQERGLGYRENGMRGQRLKDRDVIIGDARALALNKENGLRELMLRYTGLFNENKMDDNNQPITVNGEAQKIRSYEDLNSRQKIMFDKAYAAEAQSVKMKVARDLVTSQSFMDKLRDNIPGTAKNGLNDTEWEEFGKFYKDNLDQIVNSSKEGQEALNALRTAGIKPESSKGIKILTWIALILGGGMTIASLGGLATIIPAIAGTGVSGIKAVAMGTGGGADAVNAVVNGS